MLALGVAAATTVLTGALIVGESMRKSLRQLAEERLGRIDELILSENFFSEQFADQLISLPAFEEHYATAEPAILFPSASVEVGGTSQQASRVTALGIRPQFWDLGVPLWKPTRPLGDEDVVINQALADHLNVRAEDVERGLIRLTLRIPKQHQLPADSPMSKQDDLVESLVDLNVIEIVPNAGLGRFGLYPSQSDAFNLYLPIGRLQESLEQTVLKHKSNPQQANLILLGGAKGIPPADSLEKLIRQARPALEDVGVNLKRVHRNFDAATNPLANESERDKSDRSETIFDYLSLSTEKLVFNNAAASVIKNQFPDARPVFTYLANDIRPVDLSADERAVKSGIPFSMVAAIDFDASFSPISSVTNQPIAPLKENEIVLVEWAAKDLGVSVGAELGVRFFEPETTHGQQIEKTVQLRLVDIAKLTEPESGYSSSRRGQLEPAKFAQRPEVTNDPDLTPEVPGVTDAESIDRWDLPFETASKIRPQDDRYWNDHRTTPKAYVSLEQGQKLWNSRFGNVTSFRLPVGDPSAIEAALIPAIVREPTDFGLQLLPIKQRGLEASSGSTPFDILFLALSMFVIGSALILVALLFRLSFQQRAAEVGILSAVGWEQKSVRRIWLVEMSIVGLAGAVVGVCLGIGYAALMIWGLTTWWIGAISRPFLQLHLGSTSLALGLFSGWLISILTITWSLRGALKQDVRNLLAGQLESPRLHQSNLPNGLARSRWLLRTVAVLIVLAVGLTSAAIRLAGEAQAGAFMAAGFFVLLAGILFVFQKLRYRDPEKNLVADPHLNLFKLSLMNAQRNPLRSTLTIGLVAVASFLIAAVSAFRLSPTEQGTGGFDWVAQSSQSLSMDLSTVEGRAKLLGSAAEASANSMIVPLRYRQGEDASCNNLYQSSEPQILGLPGLFIDQFEPSDAHTHPVGFGWAGSLAVTEPEKMNPWRLLSQEKVHSGALDDPIPTVIDKNTANYSLKIYTLNSIFRIEPKSNDPIHFRVVGFLSNSILQGSLLISEKDFLAAFPNIGGYQYFLIREGLPSSVATGGRELQVAESSNTEADVLQKSAAIRQLEDRLGDYGFEARSAIGLLANFLKVQNTYISTFQTLGSLGLLLGTFGLAIVQMRAVLERKRELGLLQAVGFTHKQLARLVLFENLILLSLGLAVGSGAALFTTLPHGLLGNASIPWLELGLMFTVIILVGLLATGLASRRLHRIPLLESLRT